MSKQNRYILLLCMLTGLAQAQDTVFVSTSNTVYITFPEKIQLFDIGKFEEYAGEVSNEKLLKLKALKADAGISSIMVQYGETFKQFFLLAVPNVTKYHYDFGAAPVPEKKTESSPTTTLTANCNITKTRLDKVISAPAEDFSMGFISEFLQAAVTVIRNDKENTYLKIYLYNKSSIPYKFDFISFQYFQSMNKGFGKEKRKAPQDVFPILKPASTEVSPLSKTNIGYVIPQFGLANNGYLLINFREKAGDRVLKIKIKTEQIQAAKPIE